MAELTVQHEDKSSQWMDWRNQGLGSSDLPILMNVSPWCTAKQLWKYKTGLEVREQVSNFAIEKGNNLEKEARGKFAAVYNILNDANETFEAKLFEMDELKFMRSSLDGISHDGKTTIEIKYMGKGPHADVKNNIIPDKYFPQIQQQMMVAQAERAFLVSINDYNGPINYCEVPRDEEYMAIMIRQAAKFWECVQNKEWPFDGDALPLGEEVKSGFDFEDAFKKRAALTEEISKLVASIADKEILFRTELEKIEESIVKAAAGKNVSAAGFKLSFSSRIGAVDYSKVPELENIDLNLYRKPSTVTTKFGKA